MALVLSAILKLDGGAFTTPIGKAIEGLKFLSNVAMDVGGKLKDAFDMGGALTDLSAQTGEAPGQLMILKQAFEDTGVGADSLGQTLAIMRKSLSGVSESGEPTNKMFDRLGLSMDSLKGMNAQQQLEMIGGAIRNLSNDTEKTGSAMAIFGRSGSKMLSFIADQNAIKDASNSLGGLPDIMNRAAAAFDTISDRMGRIKNKTKGFWAGLAEGIAPVFDEVTKYLDSVDLSGIGQKVGDFIGTVTQMFRQADWGVIIMDSLLVGFKETINTIATGWYNLWNIIWAGAQTTADYLAQIFVKGLSKIPGVNKMLDLDGVNIELKAFGDIWDEKLQDLINNDTGKKIKLFDASKEKAELAAIYAAAAPVYQQKKRDLYEAEAKKKGTGEIDNPLQKVAASAGQAIASDALQRIGGTVGGAGAQHNMENLTKEHVGISKTMRDLLKRMVDKDANDAMVYA